MHIPWIWLPMITMVVEGSISESTSEQAISVPLWLSVTEETSNLDDTGLPSAELLEIVYIMVELSIVSGNVSFSAGPLAWMP